RRQRVGRENAKPHIARREANRQSVAAPSAEISERIWWIASISILVLAAFLRIYNLNLVPMHHDEGVNGNFLVRLVREGVYHYDPANYHGPTLYYFAAVFPWLLRFLSGPHAQNTYGLNTTAIRMVTALFGLATVGLLLMLRRNLGSIATLSAAFLLAISPGAVYLSRYFIHETLFVFFTLAIVVAAIKYFEDPHPVYLILAAASAALLFATKETAIISAGVLLLAFALTRLYHRVRSRASTVDVPTGKKRRRNVSSRGGEYKRIIEKADGPRGVTVWVLAGVGVFILLNVLFYSSFFTNYPKGIYDAFKTFEFWTKTGKEAHVHPFLTYIWWLLLQESPLLCLGAIGGLVAVSRGARPFALFSALWAFGLIAAYSLISYKTPWLCLNFLVPLALSSGFAVQWLYRALPELGIENHTRGYALGLLVLVLLGPMPGVIRSMVQKKIHARTFISGYQTVDLNFVNYDNDDRYYVYVYAHTRREALKLVDEINRIAQRTREGGATGITIVSPDYWPLPWYLRDYNRVGYYGRITPSNEPIIIASENQATDVQATFGDRYQVVQSGFNPEGSFPLRPGVELLLYTRRELVR
ncbi:MAG: flippase activity-associated protein Agl23, partial [Pyrinomonadaceae bacterium]